MKILLLSRHQFGTLRYVARNEVTVEHLGGVHGGTLYSLLRRRYIEKGSPNGRKTRIHLTREGQEELDAYLEATARERQHPGELTERCAMLLRVVRLMRAHPPERRAS